MIHPRLLVAVVASAFMNGPFHAKGGEPPLETWGHEAMLKSKNTCTNAPTIVSALRLHQLTEKKSYLEDAGRLYRWTVDRLQDPEDGLFRDNVSMDGSVDRRKSSYNPALMIRANLLLHEIKEDERFLKEAQRRG